MEFYQVAMEWPLIDGDIFSEDMTRFYVAEIVLAIEWFIDLIRSS